MDHKPVWPGWTTVRLIGRGSFGAVYEIERDILGEREKAALKVISIPQNDADIKEMISDGYDEESITSTFQEHLKNIVAEYSLMRKLNGSSNIVNCDDVRYIQHEDGYGWDIFIKMELLTPLTAVLPAEVPEAQTVRIAKDLCRALVQCRQFKIIHRDIKPQNIFVSPLGDYKLGDFGIAKTVEKTSGGTKIGTYKYMAPEVYNNQPYGAGADIYSLGLVLYWLLNERRMPFVPLPPAKLSAGTEEAARMRRFSGEPIPAPVHGSGELKRIVLKACAFDPKDRYQSADEMLSDLRPLQSDSEHPIPEQIPQRYVPASAFGVIRETGGGMNPSDRMGQAADQEKTVGAFAYRFDPDGTAAKAEASDRTMAAFQRPSRRESHAAPPAGPSPARNQAARTSRDIPAAGAAAGAAAAMQSMNRPLPMSPGGLAIRRRLNGAAKRKTLDLWLSIVCGVLAFLLLLFLPIFALILLAACITLAVLRARRYGQFSRQQKKMSKERLDEILSGAWNDRPDFSSGGIYCGERALYCDSCHVLVPYDELLWVCRSSGKTVGFWLSSGEKYTLQISEKDFARLLNDYLLPAVPDLLIGKAEENMPIYMQRIGK